MSEENTPTTATTGKLSLEDECYAMVNLSPRMTGVSRHLFVSPRTGSQPAPAKAGVRIRVSGTPGRNTLPVGAAIPVSEHGAGIGLRPRVHRIAGPMLPADVMAELEKWVAANLTALIAYWDGDSDTGELLAALKQI